MSRFDAKKKVRKEGRKEAVTAFLCAFAFGSLYLSTPSLHSITPHSSLWSPPFHLGSPHNMLLLILIRFFLNKKNLITSCFFG